MLLCVLWQGLLCWADWAGPCITPNPSGIWGLSDLSEDARSGCWKNKVDLYTQTLSALSWAGCLGTVRKSRWWGYCTCCLFTHTLRHGKTVEKRYHCQYNIGNGSIQHQHSGAWMLLDPCCITGGWQVLISLSYKASTYFPTAVCETAKR